MAENGSRATQTSPSLNLPFVGNHRTPPPRPPGPGPNFPRPGVGVHRPRLSIMTPPPPTTITLQPLSSSAMSTSLLLASTTRRPIITTATSPAVTGVTSPPSPAEVTLTAPRPDNDRVVNEYVETPFRNELVHFAGGGGKTHKQNGTKLLQRGSLEGRLSASSTGSSVHNSDRTRSGLQHGRPHDPHHQTIHLPIVPSHLHLQHNNKANTGTMQLKRRPGPPNHQGTGVVVTKQPGATATFKKELQPTSSSLMSSGQRGSGTGSGSNAAADCFRGSIICPECGRCRCESCRQPRPLPSRWLCNDACFCSAETAVDYASCLCCVKGVFYHCSKDYELDRDADGDGSCADNPCSCGYHRIYTRWACLSVLALALPCLLCYWPLKGCVGATEKCYARYANQGCRCEPRDPKITDLTPEKRLLDSHPDGF